jgi:hypothetical protein
LKVKVLFEDACRVVAVMKGDICPTEAFLDDGEDATEASRIGLLEMLQRVAACGGLQNVPAAWWHEVNKNDSIYEFKKGPLRLFFFKGKNGDVAVCTGGVRKQGQKVDTGQVRAAVAFKTKYYKEEIDYEV